MLSYQITCGKSIAGEESKEIPSGALVGLVEVGAVVDVGVVAVAIVVVAATDGFAVYATHKREAKL